MTDPAADPRAPGERRLARPPSERYGAPAPAGDDGAPAAAATSATPRAGSTARGIAFGAIAALAGAVATTILGGVFAISAGLLVVAVTTGYAVGVGVVAGMGAASDPSRRTTRRWTAVGLATAAVVLGQVGLWLFARSEGGVLSVPDYLDRTFGPLVPLQAALAIVTAWWTTR